MVSRITLCCVALLVVAGCRAREVEQDLALTDVETGWYDLGIVDGMNKLVPSVTLSLENVSNEPIARVQLNAVFRRVGEDQEWDSHFSRGIGPDGLEPGAVTVPLVMRSERGYTGSEQTRQQMLQNSQFVDARVEIFGKHGRRQWVKIGEYQIDRQLLTQ
jgi:hypothetical protein